MQFSRELILQQAPDDASAKAAQGLRNVAKWQSLGANELALWGECKGSGSKPYQVQIDLSALAFKCSCPSRKFPCKHGLALALIRAEQSSAFTDAELPVWVGEWLEGRQQRAEKQEQKKATATARKSPEDAALPTKRLERMAAGLDELERWLQDQVAQGLAGLLGNEGALERLAARMIDAQLPGVAYRLRQLAGVPGSGMIDGVDWPLRLLGAFGRLQLMIDGFRRFDSLPPDARADLSQALGLPLSKDEVLGQGELCRDEWQVLGQRVEEEERLWLRRVWLLGLNTGRVALVQDFAHGSQRFEQVFLTGSVIAAELAFYPGAHPQRALLTNSPELRERAIEAPPSPVRVALAELAAALAANPWQPLRPLRVDDGVPERTPDHGWVLRVPGQDADGAMPLRLDERDGWVLCALAGGRPLRLFGEWHLGVDGCHLRPLTAWQERALVWAVQENAE
ncbi:SWIM zinc finger domain-containing protein [Pseudomonas sp. GCM10022188]|uniref:SWIM zinc finger family protein n=1 Tax=Pseudomonas TaxID=286 RepID=UPI001E2DF804|nr:SWIM zinc finger family protein [Pseudomonas oryzagri]MCC6075895.1 SWIM zinc finger family protein [Pseudomonas oryzagri]